MKSDAKILWDYYLGDHFQFWNGATIDDSATNVRDKTRKVYRRELERIFHSYNICGRIISHYVNALVGKEYTLSLRAKNAAEKEVPEAVSLIFQNWLAWQSRSNIQKGSDRGSAVAEAITQLLVTGKGYLRLYRPKKYQRLNDPYKRIVLHCPKQGTIEAKRDEDEILYWAKYRFGEGKEEVYELLDDGRTKITKSDGEIIFVDYQGSLPVFELSGKSLISNDLMSVQKAINKLLTLWDKNLEYAGFPERVILNGQPPGHWEVDPVTKQLDKYVPSEEMLDVGADKLVYIQGQYIGDKNRPSGYTNPQMFYRDPVNVENFVKTLDSYKANGYEIAGLGHLLAQGGDRISGKSRIAGKEDYVADLGNYERIVEYALEEVISLVGLLLNLDYPLNLDQYQPVIDLNLSIASPPEEREQNRLDFQAGAMSLPTLITARGQDSNPEMSAIEADRKRQLDFLNEGVDLTTEEGVSRG